MKERIVESGHQWCAVATGGHVSTPKISNSRNAGAVGNDVRIADLEAEGSLVLSRRAVPNRLPVATNGCHLPGGISGFFESFVDSASEDLPQVVIQCAHRIDFIGVR